MMLKKKEAFMVVMKSDYIPGIISKILVSAGLYAKYKRQKSRVDFKTHMF